VGGFAGFEGFEGFDGFAIEVKYALVRRCVRGEEAGSIPLLAILVNAG
jgi:hypothetical protein